VQTADGRTLSVQADDSPGSWVLVHNGTPNGRLLYPPALEDARSHGLRLVSYDRPGYGGSTAQPGRTVADCVADVRAICASLGIERLGVWGISGGGPHALACAALAGDLVAAVASLASVAPYGAAGLDYFDGMGEENVEDTKLELADPAAARRKAAEDRLEMLALDADQVAAAIATLVGPADAAALEGPVAEYLVQSGRDALAPGVEGWVEDGKAHLEPWGFDLSAIAVPVLLLHGADDRFVPIGHGRWLAAQIPGVDARFSETDGHLTLLTDRIPEVHAWLAAQLA